MNYDNTKSLGQNAINGVDITAPAEYANEQGKCPKCRGYNLDYQPIDYADTMCYYRYKCEDCGQEGEEWYKLDFQGHNVYGKDGEVIEL